MLRFLGVGGATVTPSPFMQALAAANDEDDIAIAVLDRVWQLNPLLGKTVLELVAQRAYHKDEIYKHLGSSAYRGIVPSRPALETWLQIAIARGLLRTLGVAIAAGPRIERYVAARAGARYRGVPRRGQARARAGHPDRRRRRTGARRRPRRAAVDTSIPVAAAAPTGSPLPAPLRHLSADGIPSPRDRERAVPLSRFAAGFADDVLAETTAADRRVVRRAHRGIDDVPARPTSASTPSSGSRTPTRSLYRIAVAAALAFRLDRDRAGVIAAYTALDKAGVLADLYQGTVPENLPAQVDARALMLASLAARRCAEVPELAASSTVAAPPPRRSPRSTPRSAAACSAPSCSGSSTCSRTSA